MMRYRTAIICGEPHAYVWFVKIYIFFPCLVSPRRSSIGPSDDVADSEFPGQHFQGDLLLLALGSSQKDLFEDDWLDVMVRVYWLKARFLALQVWFIFCCFFCLGFNTQLSQMWHGSLCLSSLHRVTWSWPLRAMICVLACCRANQRPLKGRITPSTCLTYG